MASKRVTFAALILALQAVFIVVMGIFAEYADSNHTSVQYYPNFQDVNVMVFIGLGFLVTFLKNYGHSAIGFNMVIGGFCVQYAFLVRGFIHVDILDGKKFQLGVSEMTTALFASATVLISYCVLLGKVSATQLVVMAMIELPLAQVNEYIGFHKLYTSDIGESIYLHMFAAYFGLAVARVLYVPEVESNAKEGSVYHSDLFAMIGSVFLWIYWPSFNGGFTEFSERATLNTFLSLCACTVVTFAVSGYLDKHGRFDMVHVQNAVLAGGVVVGATADMPMEPYAAMCCGAVGGLVCVLGYKYVQPFLASKLKIHDTCGVHNLHGMPAIVAALGSAVLAAMSSDWDDRSRAVIFPKTVGADPDRSEIEQGGYQLLAVVMTLAFAIGGGVFTGFILKMPIWNVPKGGQLFDDTDNWELPTEGFPSGAQKRQHHGYSNEMSHENGKNGNNQEDGDQSDQFTKM